jgi:hypothetical protein
VPLFIDRLPFHRWTDSTLKPPVTHFTIVVPIVLTEPTLLHAPSPTTATDWVLDTGNRGEAVAWRSHLVQSGLDPDQYRLPMPRSVRTVAGRLTVPVRYAHLWLVSNIPAWRPTPHRMVLHHGLPFHDIVSRPDPVFQRPLVGIRALRSAGLKVEIDFANDTISVWTPDVQDS